MIDETPSAEAIIASISELLTDEVMPQLSRSDTRYKLLVARNALGIVSRELALGKATAEDELQQLNALAGCNSLTLRAAREALCEQLRRGDADEELSAMAKNLLPSTLARLAIDNPGYSTLTAFSHHVAG